MRTTSAAAKADVVPCGSVRPPGDRRASGTSSTPDAVRMRYKRGPGSSTAGRGRRLYVSQAVDEL